MKSLIVKLIFSFVVIWLAYRNSLPSEFKKMEGKSRAERSVKVNEYNKRI